MKEIHRADGYPDTLMSRRFKKYWIRFWLKRGGLTKTGRMAFRLASWFAPPHKMGAAISMLTPAGYIVPNATIFHPNLKMGVNIYIGDRVQVFGEKTSGQIIIGDRVRIFRDTILDSGDAGSITIGADTSIHPRCQLNAYLTSIYIGKGVLLAANCCMYPHDHGMAGDRPILDQPLQTKGPITIGDYAWLGAGVTVLGGVSIGKGAVIGAGAVVTKDIPANSIAVGLPAKVVKMREC